MGKLENLEKLLKLKEQGVLSEEEFSEEKKKILNEDSEKIIETTKTQITESKKEEIQEKKIEENINPQNTNNGVSNGLAWAVAVVPIIGIFIEVASGKSLWYVYLIINTLFCVIDMNLLKDKGFKIEGWTILIIPIYLWKRATVLKQDRGYFLLWILAFFISIIISLVSSNGGLSEADVKKQTCDLLTKKIQEQGLSVKCENIIITKKQSDGSYWGIVYFSDDSKNNIEFGYIDGYIQYELKQY